MERMLDTHKNFLSEISCKETNLLHLSRVRGSLSVFAVLPADERNRLRWQSQYGRNNSPTEPLKKRWTALYNVIDGLNEDFDSRLNQDTTQKSWVLPAVLMGFTVAWMLATAYTYFVK